MKYHRRIGRFNRPKSIKKKKRRIEKTSQFKKREFRNPYFEKKEPPFILIVLKRYYQYLIVFGVFVFLLWGFLFSTFFQVQTIDIQGNEFVSTENLRMIVDEQIHEHKYFVFSQQNMAFFDKDSLHEKLLDQYAFEELIIDKDYRHTIHVIVKEKIPGVTYQNAENIFRIDLDGVVTQQISEEERTRQLPHIRDENQREIHPNNQVISKEWLAGLFYVEENSSVFPEGERLYAIPKMRCVDTEQIEQEILVPLSESSAEDEEEDSEQVSIVVDDDTQVKKLNSDEYKLVVEAKEVEVEIECEYLAAMQDAKVYINDSWYVYFDFSGNLADQLAALQVVLSHSIDDVSGIEYIDVRIPSRVFYK